MAYERPGEKLSGHTAAADYSTTGQFLGVAVTAEGVVTLAAGSTGIVGVLQNDPILGQAAEIMATGETKVYAGAAIAIGAEVEFESGGKVITLASGTKKGVALAVAAADGDLITVLLQG